jgi:hypothetical protein
LSEYAGEWKNGNKHGKGTEIYVSKAKYMGHWQNGQKRGKGIFTTSEGIKLEGEWSGDVLEGKVTEIYPDGKTIIVGRINHKRHGPGIIIYSDGTRISGEWKNDKLVGSLNFYMFSGSEFEAGYNKTALCIAIKKDIGLTFRAKECTVNVLNKLLKVPDLYEAFNKKIHKIRFSREINDLIDQTEGFRNKQFSALNNDMQKSIVKLNRHLLEHIYPHKTPKSESR